MSTPPPPPCPSLCPQGVHHRADLWPEPLKYDPTRFLRPDGTDHADPFAFLPFIQGPRNCLGQHLALLEARLVLGTVVKARWRCCAHLAQTCAVTSPPVDCLLTSFTESECESEKRGSVSSLMSPTPLFPELREPPQLFKFKCVRPDAGDIDSKMIPIGPTHGMQMTVE